MGLYVIAQETVTPYRLLLSSAPMANGIPAMTFDENGILWIVSSAGLHAMLPDRQMVHYPCMVPDGGFTCMAAGEGTVWLGTFHNGIYTFDIASSTLRHAHDLIVPVSSLQACGEHRLLVGTDGAGVLLLDSRDFSTLHSWSQHTQGVSRLTSNSVYSVLLDKRDVLWVGLYQDGVDYTYWQDDELHVHQTPMFDSEGIAVRALCIHDQQRLIGTRQGLYFIDKATQRFRRYGEKELNAQMVFALAYYEGLYYIGTYGGGLLTLNPATLQLSAVRFQNSDIGRQVFSLTEDASHRLWMGTEKGAYCLASQGGKLQIQESFNARNSQLPAGIVYHIFFDRLGRGWMCTANGMALYDPLTHAVAREAFPQSFPSSMVVRQVWQAENGLLYFVQDKGGIYVIDEQWQAHAEPEIEGNDALFISDDGRGSMLIGTNNGLYYNHVDGMIDRYDFSDGLPSSTFTLCLPQIDEEGTVWLGNSRGLVWMHPDSMHFPRPARAAHLSLLLSDNTPIGDGIQAVRNRSLRLPRSTTDFTVELSDLSFTYPACMRYECMLKGIDKEWQLLSGVSEYTWHNLQPGFYTLRLRHPGDTEHEFSMRVWMPMSKAALASIGLAIITLLIIVGTTIERIRIRRARKAREAKEREAEEAAETAEERKYKTTNIPTTELRKLKKALDELMTNEQLYLNPELKLSDLANRLNTSSFVLSYLFNQHMKLSFYDYINQFRVENFKQRVKSGEAKMYSLDALATRCGYNSRTSFFRNFKKATGMTPSEYIAGK